MSVKSGDTDVPKIEEAYDAEVIVVIGRMASSRVVVT